MTVHEILAIYKREVVENTTESKKSSNQFLEYGSRLAKYAEHLAPVFKAYSVYQSFQPSPELVAIRELNRQMHEQTSQILHSLDSLRSSLPEMVTQALRQHHLETVLIQLRVIDEATWRYQQSIGNNIKPRIDYNLAEVRKACLSIDPKQVLEFVKLTYTTSDDGMCRFYDALDWNANKVHSFMTFLENLVAVAVRAGLNCLVFSEVFMPCSEEEQASLINQENAFYKDKLDAIRNVLRPMRCDKMRELFHKFKKHEMYVTTMEDFLAKHKNLPDATVARGLFSEMKQRFGFSGVMFRVIVHSTSHWSYFRFSSKNCTTKNGAYFLKKKFGRSTCLIWSEQIIIRGEFNMLMVPLRSIANRAACEEYWSKRKFTFFFMTNLAPEHLSCLDKGDLICESPNRVVDRRFWNEIVSYFYLEH